MLKHTFIYLITFLGVSGVFAQQELPHYSRVKIKHRLSVGPVSSMYQNHKQHTENTKAKVGFSLAYKAEVLLNRKTYLHFGLEYFNQGLQFKGYYSAPGHTYLFDRTYAYSHELRIKELHLPIAIKVNLNKEKDHLVTPYFFAGVGARYIYGSYVIIMSDSTGTTVYDGKGKIDFENQLAVKGLNAFYQGGLGFQRNFKTKGKAVFFEMTYKYGISRIHYTGYNNSNNLNIKDAHLLFAIGCKL